MFIPSQRVNVARPTFILAVLLMYQASVNGQESCTVDGEVRLDSFPISRIAGRIEICRNNVWGSICVDNDQVAWSEKNSQVACRELGFSGALNSLWQETAPAPPSPTQSHHYSVRCNGSESSIALCSAKNGVNQTICRTSRAAHIVCRADVTDLDVRLVGDTNNGRGAVEVFDRIHGWVSLCPDSRLWSDSQANAVCAQLGYEGGVSTTYMIPESTTASATIVDRRVSIIDCTGDKVFTLQECSINFPLSESCSAGARQFAGVTCSSSSSPPGSLRLFGTLSSNETRVERGRLEVLYDGKWGAVCSDTQFSSIDGQTACQELGFDITSVNQVSINPIDVTVLGRTTNLPIWLGGLQCDFSSTKLSACERNDASIGFATFCDQRNTVLNRDATLDCNRRSRGSSLHCEISMMWIQIIWTVFLPSLLQYVQ